LAGSVNVTSYDTLVSGDLSTWYNRGTSPGEDQETEPGTSTGQKWDLEGFFTNGTNISMVGGYDFKNGYGGEREYATAPGHLFIANNQAAQYGENTPNFTGKNIYGYNYAVTMNFDTLKYSLYIIDADTTVVSTTYEGRSNPWQFQGGTLVDNGNGYTGTLQYTTGLSDAQTGFLSDANQLTHNEVILLGIGDHLDGYTAANYFAWLHYTYACGNDLLMGNIVGSPVPIPGSVLLLGTGLLGLVGLKWRRRETNA
jgi:hypothetical protein